MVEGMKHALATLLLLAVLLPVPKAIAMDQEMVLRCVLAEALAALTCKHVNEFRFVGRRADVYVFNAHYAAKFTEFYCQVFDKDVVITSKAWQGNMASLRLNFDAQPGCIIASVDAPWGECRAPKSVQCCGVQ